MNDETTFDVLVSDLQDKQQSLKNDLQALFDAVEWVKSDLREIDSLKAKINEITNV